VSAPNATAGRVISVSPSTLATVSPSTLATPCLFMLGAFLTQDTAAAAAAVMNSFLSMRLLLSMTASVSSHQRS